MTSGIWRTAAMLLAVSILIGCMISSPRHLVVGQEVKGKAQL
jgi:hypothetical protein